MAHPRTLLQRHMPLLRYDKQEVYFADSAATWTDGPQQLLRDAGGKVLASARPSNGQAQLSLAFLRTGTYETGKPAASEDYVGCTTRDYEQLARRLHVKPKYRNRIYGRWVTGSDGRLWLQYWFFYFYNDFNLLGSTFAFGLHEGDWEMVQLRLNAAGIRPDLAVYAQHKYAGARTWGRVERVGERPVVYVARGSHASYFAAGRNGLDQVDGAGFSPTLTMEVVEDDDPAYAWMLWPGYWGDTRPRGLGKRLGYSSFSPTGPGSHDQWDDPVALLKTAEDYKQYLAVERPATPAAPAAPKLRAVTRAGDMLRVEYACPRWPATGAEPAQLLVTLNSPEDKLPPTSLRVPISSPSGTAEIPGALRDDWSYDVTVSVADADGVSSGSTREQLAKG